MSLSLQNILSDTDLNKIPSNIRNQIDIVLESKCKSLDLEKQRVQLIDKDYNDYKTRYELNSNLINTYKGHLAQLESDVHNARKSLCDSNHEKDLLDVKLKNQQLELESKEEQIQRLNDLVKIKNQDAIELNEKYSKLQIELEETRKLNNSSIEVEEERFINILAEKDKLCELQCNYLKEELNRVTQEFHEKSSKYNSLNSEFINYKNETEIQLNDLNKENSSFKNQITFLKNQIDKKDDQINDLAVKLKEMNQHQDLIKEQYDIEKKEHSDLLSYYKKVNDENQITQNEILNQIKALEENHELREKQLEQSIDKLANDNHQLQEEIRLKENVILDLKIKIEELKSQILNLNQKQVDNAVNQFYPTSNTMSKLFENNMPLSTVYSKYEELQTKCQNLVDENQELKLRIQEMISESESNAPLIYYKTQEVKKANAEVEEYKMQLSKISSDLANSFSEIDNYNKMNNYLKRELKRYEKSNIDLTRQVQCLLQSVHELRGNFISNKFLVNDEHLAKENEYDRSISLNLVTFKNIEEMHENNKKLLSDLRGLSDHLDELKETNQVKDDESFKKHLDELLLEIESLKEENRHKQEILSEMMAERESKLGTGRLDTSLKDKQGSTSSLFKITSRAYLEDKVADLASKLDTKIEEFNNFKQEAKDQESKLKDEINKYQQQITNYQNEISKLTVKLDSISENNKVLDSTLNRYNKETNLIKERNIKLEEQRKTLKERIGTFESKKNELVSKLEEMKKDLDTKTNLINILEKQNTQVKCENEMIKSSLSEKKSELQEIRNKMLQVETESKVNSIRSECELKNKIQMLELTNSNLNDLNTKLLDKEKHYKMLITESRKKVIELTDENTAMEKEKENLRKKLKEYQDKLTEIEQSTDENSTTKAKILKMQMDLKNQLEEKSKRLLSINSEKDKYLNELRQKEQELLRMTKLKAEMESQVQTRMDKLQKIADEGLLKEKLLKNRVEALSAENKKKDELLNSTKKELSSTKEELLKNQLHNQYKMKQQKMQSKADTEQQQQTLNQSASLTPTTAKSVIAKINPTVVNRSQIQSTTGNTSSSFIPQATITPTTQSTQSPTAYVAPTSVTNLEVSSAENLSSNISSSTTASLTPSSFSLPSTSSNLLSSSNNQEQQRHSFSMASTTSPAMPMKRQRITLSDYHQINKKQKSEALSSLPSTSALSQSTQSHSDNLNLFGNKNQIEQATCSSSSVNDQEMVSVAEEPKTSQEEQKEIIKSQDDAEATKQEKRSAEVEETKNEQQQDQQQLIEQAESNEIVNQEADGNSLGLEASNTESQDKPQQTRDSPTSNLVNTEEMEDNDDNLEEGEEEEDDEDEEDNNNEIDDEEYSGDEENNQQLTDNEDDYESENSDVDDEEEKTNQGSNTQDQARNSSDIICLSDDADGEEENADNNQQFDNQQPLYVQVTQNIGQRFENQQQEMDTEQKDEEFHYDSDQQHDQMLSNEDYNAANSLSGFLETESNQNQNYPDSANQLEQIAINQESVDQSHLRMPMLTELGRADPYDVQKNENVDYNLIIDEQPIESETHFVETDSNSLTSNLNTLASATEQKAQLDMPKLSELADSESMQEEENSNQQSQQIDQTKLTSTNLQSTMLASTSNQQKKSRLKRPNLRLNVNEQKKNQDKPE